MAATEFGADVRAEDGGTVIDLRGDIDGSAGDALREAYAAASKPDPSIVVLNFHDVDYINSTGIAVIVGILAQARQEGRRLVAYGLTDHYRSIFEVTRIADFIHLYGDERSALAGTA